MAATNKVIKPLMKHRLPVIVILGSTAVGKSKLGIELAKKLNGEIISADSMQVYKGLDIITNKVTPEEQCEVRHHLINIVKPPSEFNVVEFQKKALSIVDDLHSKEKVPIIVGGTNYYIESVLWSFLIKEQNETDSMKDADQEKQCTDVLKRKIEHNDTDFCNKKSLHEQLVEVDVERANQLHPNDVRKIARSLQIYRQSGKRHSKLLNDQKKEEGSSHLGGPLRFSKVLVFWLTCEQSVLDRRISKRIDEMLGRGMLEEVGDFYQQYKKDKYDELKKSQFNKTLSSNISESSETSSPLDQLSSQSCIDNKMCDKVFENTNGNKLVLYEEGLFQAIGFKEFHPYFTSSDSNLLNKTEILKQCLENFKRVTIKYSKKQKKWVHHRFVTRENAPNVYHLDATDLGSWEENVFQTAYMISQQFLQNQDISVVPVAKPVERNVDKHKRHVCEICDNKLIVGDNIWEIHLKSRSHRRKLQRINKEK